MPTVNYIYESSHVIAYNNGAISAYPALPATNRLYVVYNSSTNRAVYVGTSTDVQNRFDARLKACRELGFNAAQLDPVLIFVVRIVVNGVASPPGNSGVSSGINVEHLLIRTYDVHINCGVRNIDITGQFTNGTGGILTWTLVNQANIGNFGGPYNFNLAIHAVL